MPLVAFCCGICWAAYSADDLKRSAVPPAVDRFHDPGGGARQKPPPPISMAAHCVHAGPTSRHTRQSRLPDRKAARRRRGLDGRGAVVTRITAALMLGFIRLYYGPRYDLSLLGIFSAWGVTRKLLGLLLAYHWGLLVRLGISLVSLVSLVRGGFWQKRPSNRSS